MKRVLMSIILSLAFFGMMKAQDEGRTWLKRYNIDPMNDNPVFTRPLHENDESRVMGAGICMNDGLAYNSRLFTLGREWHYEPKLYLCKEEEEAFPRVTGEYLKNENNRHISTVGQILKNGVIPTDFGCIVAYRVWAWGDDDHEQVRHYFATFDHKGNLIDAFYAGYPDWMYDVLAAEPHGAGYTPRHNMGGGSMKFSEDNKTFTKTDYNYFNTPDNKNNEWHDTTVINISDKGLFSVASHVQTGKPAVNKLMDELYSLETLPLSDKSAIKKWNAFVKKTKGNQQLRKRIDMDVLKLYLSRQQEFMAWTTANKKESVLITALVPGLQYLMGQCGTGAAQMLYADGLDNCKDNVVKNYWKNLKTIKKLWEY